jgi:hypothetical protein
MICLKTFGKNIVKKAATPARFVYFSAVQYIRASSKYYYYVLRQVYASLQLSMAQTYGEIAPAHGSKIDNYFMLQFVIRP